MRGGRGHLRRKVRDVTVTTGTFTPDADISATSPNNPVVTVVTRLLRARRPLWAQVGRSARWRRYAPDLEHSGEIREFAATSGET
jgi:hypothetical protein